MLCPGAYTRRGTTGGAEGPLGLPTFPFWGLNVTTAVRLFSFPGVVQAKAFGVQKVSDTFLMDKQPYLAREAITCTDSAATETSSSLCPADTDFVLIQVEAGKVVFLEVNSAARDVAADTSSPYISGDVRVKAGEGTIFSFRDFPQS